MAELAWGVQGLGLGASGFKCFRVSRGAELLNPTEVIDLLMLSWVLSTLNLKSKDLNSQRRSFAGKPRGSKWRCWVGPEHPRAW